MLLVRAGIKTRDGNADLRQDAMEKEVDSRVRHDVYSKDLFC